jgi:membrane protein
VWPFTSYRILKRAFVQFSNDRGPQMGAALAYYSLFSIAPLLVISISIAGAILGEEQARQSAVILLRDNMGPDAATAVEEALTHVRKPAQGVLPTAAAVALLFFGALGVFLQVRSSFSTIWGLPPHRGSTVLGLAVNYALASLMVLLMGIVLLASVLLTTFTQWVAEWAPDRLAHFGLTWESWRLLEFGISFLFVTVVFALVYRVMSGRHISLVYVLYGAGVAALLFTAGKTLLGIYLSYAHVASVYGTGGSVAAFLIWIYYSSQTMILGAELIQARRTRKQWMNATAEDAGKGET